MTKHDAAGPFQTPSQAVKQWSSQLSLETPAEAALEACARAVAADVQGSVDVAFLFVSGHPLASSRRLPGLLRQRFPGIVVMGCNAMGVIGAGREVEGVTAVSLTAAHLPGIAIHPFHLEAEGMPDLDGPPEAWQRWVGVPADSRPSFILLADAFTFDVEGCLRGLDYAYPRRPKLGGLASGAQRPGDTQLFLLDQTWRDGLVGIAFGHPLRLDALVAQGCRPIGRPMVVTECEKNVLLSVDHETPLTVLQRLVPSLAARERRLLAGSLFLGLAGDPCQTTPGPGEFLIRNVLGVDTRLGSVAAGSLLRRGQQVQFHVRDAASSAQDLESLCEAHRADTPQVAAALLFSCLGRGRHLYGQPDHDSRIFERCVAPVPIGGFFCNGEIGPVADATYVHGYTSSFAIFRWPC